MEMGAIVLLLVGVVALLMYRSGRRSVQREELKGEVQTNEQRKRIRNMSDSELDDELSEHWK